MQRHRWHEIHPVTGNKQLYLLNQIHKQCICRTKVQVETTGKSPNVENTTSDKSKTGTANMACSNDSYSATLVGCGRLKLETNYILKQDRATINGF